MNRKQEIEKIAGIILPIKEGKTWVNWTIALELAKDIYEAGYRLDDKPSTAKVKVLVDGEFHEASEEFAALAREIEGSLHPTEPSTANREAIRAALREYTDEESFIARILSISPIDTEKLTVLSDEEIEAEVNFESVARAQLAHTIKEIKGE